MMSLRTRIWRNALGVLAALALSATACGGSDAVESQTAEAADTAESVEITDDSPPSAFATDDSEDVDGDTADESTAEAPSATNDAAAFGGAAIPEVDDVDVTGDSLVVFDATVSPDPAVGVAAPVFEATNLADGERITLPADGGVIIGFVAHWCPHCQAEVPELVNWLGTGALGEDITFVAVSTAVVEERGNFPPSQWLSNEGWPGLAVADDGQASLLATFGFSGFPAFVAIDADGIVVDRIGGNVGVAGFDRLAASLAE